jgi:hypothetical protein
VSRGFARPAALAALALAVVGLTACGVGTQDRPQRLPVSSTTLEPTPTTVQQADTPTSTPPTSRTSAGPASGPGASG